MAISLIDPVVMPFISTFLFVFALIFGLLSYSKIGEFNKKVNALLALAIAGFSVMYEPLVLGMQQYMPIAAAVLIVVFFFALLKKIFGKKEGDKAGDTVPLIITLAVLLLLMVAFGQNLTSFLPAGMDPQSVLWGVGIIIAVLFFWLIYKTKETPQ
ncbi:MAG TPA: hypothetical protein HA230_01065 [Candidatus Aenigmarchaeota archaeon]|nr:hypothetical protein [Candidatus Aenigmarchaeota archaeon]